jgi:hypothetical protein
VIDISQELADILKTWRHTQREEQLILGASWLAATMSSPASLAARTAVKEKIVHKIAPTAP